MDANRQRCSTDRSTGPRRSGDDKESTLHGYVTCKRDRYYAVIYEGLDPVTGRERRSWHPAGTDRSDAERLAAHLAEECNGRNEGSQKVTVARPRGRFVDGGEVELATWDTLASEDLPRQVVVERMLAGVACRRHVDVTEPIGVEGKATVEVGGVTPVHDHPHHDRTSETA